MKENILLNLSQELSVEVLTLSNNLRNKKEYSIANQIKRSCTSVSANIAEANYPQSKLDMISKFEIALKEANETENWLNIIYKSNFISENDFKIFNNKIIKIKILLIKSIKTLKK